MVNMHVTAESLKQQVWYLVMDPMHVNMLIQLKQVGLYYVMAIIHVSIQAQLPQSPEVVFCARVSMDAHLQRKFYHLIGFTVTGIEDAVGLDEYLRGVELDVK